MIISRHLHSTSCIVLVVIYLCFSMCFGQINDVNKRVEFRAEREIKSAIIYDFNNIAIEQQRNGQVYIGARNRLYQLSSDLRNFYDPIITGPIDDTTFCKRRNPGCMQTGLTDNINKILLIDYLRSRIIICGSVEQGICNLYQKGNIQNQLTNLNINNTASRQSVAANGYLSTVGFIATSQNSKTSLYVGSSKTVQDEPELRGLIDSYYTVSKRRLPANNEDPDMFSVEGFTAGYWNDIGIQMNDAKASKNFRVTFIDGFATNVTGYFVITHPPPNEDLPYLERKYMTYMSQICLEENIPEMRSYLELPLECNFGGIRYTRAVASRTAKVGSLLQSELGIRSGGSTANREPTDVVFISFVQSNNRPGSAVCMFSLREIELKFLELINSCMKNGETSSKPGHISWLRKGGNTGCGISTFDDVLSPVCLNKELWDVIQFLQGGVLSKDAVYATNNTSISAIEVTHNKDREHTVAFFGTEDGRLIKVRLDSAIMGSPENVEYETVVVSQPTGATGPNDLNESVVKTIRLGYGDNTESQRVYALTPSVVVGLPLFNCTQYTDCSTCLGSKDPFCGWCTLDSKCSSSGDCEQSNSGHPYRFIKSGGQCPRLASDEPLMLTASQPQITILLQGYNIPMQSNMYECAFGDIYRQRVSNLQQESTYLQIRCISPPPDQIPDFAPGEGHLTVPLSLVYGSGSSGKVIVSTNFTFYRCSVYSSCMSCVRTEFNCTWCVKDNICTHQSTTDCNPGSDVEQPNNCPQLTSYPDGNKEYIAEGKVTNINVPVMKLFDEWRKFTCEIDGRTFDGVRISGGSQIKCTGVLGTLPAGTRMSTVPMRIFTQDHNIEIDNPIGLTVEIYRCGVGANGNCGTCLQSPTMWQCGWCETSDQCTLNEACSDWLEASENKSCKHPEIVSFDPSSAPFGGNSTVIRMRGVNFDLNSNMQVTVAGATCTVIGANCCEVECVPHAKSKISGSIFLCVTSDNVCLLGDAYQTTTGESFHFVDPKVESFEPLSGLRGWGTRIILRGEHLNTGNGIVVSVDGSPCIVEETSENRLTCRLECDASGRSRRDVATAALRTLYRGQRSLSTAERRITASFDGVNRIAKNGYFDFVEGVAIFKIEPTSTIRSGGLPLTVTGVNLNLIQNPQIKVTLLGKTYRNKCRIKYLDSKSLICQSPDVSPSPFFYSEDYAYVHFELESEGCGKSVRYNSSVRYKPDPSVDLFDGESRTKKFSGEQLYITGHNLCPDREHCYRSTVHVWIGDDMDCNVTRLDIDQIACQPPVGNTGSYEVTVRIGGYSESVGYLEYTEKNQFPVGLVVAVIVVAILLGLVVLCIICVYRRRAHEKEQELKEVHMQMSKLESSVAKVCKESFAELQTDMTQLDTISGAVGIPYHDYRVYLMRVLFPDPMTSEIQHTLLLSHMGRNESRTNSNRIMTQGRTLAMDRFNALLEKKLFLVSFIKTLERQRSFSMKDKATVAGLILVILQDRLSYATEILEHLLADLIRKSMESNNHPKLLLRRTESVAEKMLTHWFSILLHRFVVECAGEPLFTLYRAIKQQVDKGPLDACTTEARYSLSEDKLLRQTVDHELVVLRVTNYLADHDQPEFTVKVLSCDSISQVKRKILDVAYLNVPYSRRPHPDDVALEWRQERLGKYVLRDDDATSKIEGEWKRVNTLEHYSVKSNDKISVIPRQEPSVLNYSAISNASKASGHKRNGSGSRLLPNEGSNTSLPRYKQQSSRSGTPTLPVDGSRTWHLVKPIDQDQREDSNRGNKMVSEIYLTRLLTTKGTIQKYVDDLLETIFSAVQRGHVLPPAVKHMFDFLDHQADIHGVTDPDIVHTWKSNCLPLRFWVNLIKNPEFVYDIHKSPIVDRYLSVIAGAFMDSCSTAEYKLGKDSPSNKLLYAKEIPHYREWVARYYSDISSMPSLHPRDLSAFLQEESFVHSQDFNKQAALAQLYNFVQKYSDEILGVLDADPEARRQGLLKQLEYVSVSMNGGT